MLPILGMIIGLIIGVFFIPVNIPNSILFIWPSPYLRPWILYLEALLLLQGKFNMKVFISGFFGNALLAAALAYIGDQLGLQLHAAIFAFVTGFFSILHLLEDIY